MNLKRMTIMLAAVALLLTGCHSTRKSAVREPEQAVVKHRHAETRIERKEAAGLEKEARKWLGTPYKYGGQTREGTDCSGMVMTVYEKVTGIKLPRDSRSQQQFCNPVSKRELTAGDLVFFSSSKNNSKVSHVGLYIGSGEFIHASTSRGVIISRLEEPYYASHYHSGGRVPGMSKGKPEPTPKKKEIRKEVKAVEVPLSELDKVLTPETFSIPDTVATPPPPAAQPQLREDTTASPSAKEKKQNGLADSIRTEVRRAMRF